MHEISVCISFCVYLPVCPWHSLSKHCDVHFSGFPRLHAWPTWFIVIKILTFAHRSNHTIDHSKNTACNQCIHIWSQWFNSEICPRDNSWFTSFLIDASIKINIALTFGVACALHKRPLFLCNQFHIPDRGWLWERLQHYRCCIHL